MAQSVSVSCSFLQKYLPAAGIEKTYVLFELNGKGKAAERPPVNLSLVLDRSGSMWGKPLDYCKEAAKFVVNQLQEKDILNVVVFDGEVETVLPPQEVKYKDLLKKKIDGIETGGITNLSGGLIKGCQQLLSCKKNQYINRLILLSDGQANTGITNHGQLMKVVDEYHKAGAVMTTMGVSDHFNEELMEGIAEHGKGNYYFIEQVEQIPDIFARELEGLLSVVAQDVNVKITPKNGLKLEGIYGYMTEEKSGDYLLSLGDMYSNEVKSILVEFTMPAMAEGIHELFNIEWTYVDVTDGVKECCSTLNVSAEVTKDLQKLSEPVDYNVDKQVEITKSAQKLEEAMQFFDEGDLETGKEVLYAQAAIMAEKAEMMEDSELMKESQMIIEKLDDFDYSPKMRKELHQAKYRQMKRRK